jgi:deoxyadenosine/deoxycytidine kinase
VQLEALKFVAVEGAIGSGKTSLARKLAERFRAELLLERPADNPFLERFYADRERHALATQLTFLFQRADQMRVLAQHSLFQQPTISDYLLDKDPIFARLTLADEEYSLYSKIYEHLAPSSPAPDLLIVLQASLPTLLARIERRGLPYERSIDAEYLMRLNDSYVRHFHHYERAPVLFVNTEGLNFVENASHLDLLIEKIVEMRGARAFFSIAQA